VGRAALHLVSDSPPIDRKARGAFFTPTAIAQFLAEWAIARQPNARVLDPMCGEGVFLDATSKHLLALGADAHQVTDQVFGIDIDKASLQVCAETLRNHGVSAQLLETDFFTVDAPNSLFGNVGSFDAVIGNPPFVRYQHHTGDSRRASLAAAIRQGVRLSGLASSWAASLIHASAFLRPQGRLAMVLPAELLTVGYAEPVRRWLRQRFADVKLVIFERLQFDEALENVVLVLAHGQGGCDAFSLYFVQDAADLQRIQPMDGCAVTLSSDAKWTDLLLTISQRQVFKTVLADSFGPLDAYGAPELGTVTGANGYFTLSESVRREYKLEEGKHVVRVSPPGTRHFRGSSFTTADWERLRNDDEAVWLLWPSHNAESSSALRAYVAHGERLGIPSAYKCQIRSPWWRPPAVSPPDLFFTYMSHKHPRLITNRAKVTFVNSMHGLRLRANVPKIAREALPLITLNSVSMLGAEVYGRSYGGGVLKMEPREAAMLPVPNPAAMAKAWDLLRPERDALNRQLRNGLWTNVVARVDEILLQQTLGVSPDDAATLHEATRTLRTRRLTRGTPLNDNT
jgi:tRNA1(Val) A37 N6-methylase TrmN6